MHVYIHIDR